MSPDVFATALVAIFCDYSEEIVCRVSDPRTGIAGKQKWFPSIAEIRHECELLAAKQREVAAWNTREKERLKALPPPPVDRTAVMARMRARYPEAFAEVEEKSFASHAERAEALGERYRSEPIVASDLLLRSLSLKRSTEETG